MPRGINFSSESRICCLYRRPDETPQVQRQQYCLRSRILLLPPKTRRNLPGPKAANAPQKQDFAASAEDPKKLTKIKGSNLASEAGFCCFRRRPDETRQEQRQLKCLEIKNLLLLPKTRRNLPSPKAANAPQKQDFAASVKDPKKLTKIKGSNLASEAGFCCFRQRPEETYQDQRQQSRLGSRILLLPPKTL